MPLLVHAVDRPEISPFRMPDRFRHEITFFMTLPGEHGVPPLPRGEYWVRQHDVRQFLDDGVVRIVSPLDTDNKAELELSEDQERWLEWMLAHQIEHVRLE